MEKLLDNSQIFALSNKYGYEYKAVKAVIQVESGQHGFSAKTGKVIIQFEPAWFKRLAKDWQKDTKHTLWQSNRVGDQTQEWLAFNDAFGENPDAAMKSTSIGMMQVMGFHYSEIGYHSVGEMWDAAKESEYNQVSQALNWVKTVPALDKALRTKNWSKVAYYYNGESYIQFHYDERLAAAYRLVQDYKGV